MFYIYLFIFNLVVGIGAQQCSPILNDTPIFRDGPCVHRTSEYVWSWNELGYTQEYLWAQSIPYTNFVHLMSDDCAQTYLQLMCPTLMPSCTILNDNIVVLIPVCKSLCEETNIKCKSFWQQNNLPIINCNQSWFLDNRLEQWPNQVFNKRQSQDNEPNQIFNKYDNEEVNQEFHSNCLLPEEKHYPIPCPKPLIYIGPDVDYYTGLSCSSTCRDKLHLQQSDFESMFLVAGILNIISLVATIFVLLTYLIIRPLRAWPQRVILCMGVGMLIQHSVLCINFWMGIDDALCQNEYELDTTGWAVASGFFLLFGALITASWWLFQAGLVFWCIGLLRQDVNRILYSKIMWVVHTWNWGYPLIAAIVCLLDSKEDTGTGLGALEGIPWAFTSWYSINGVVWALFYAVILTYLCCIIIFGLVGLYRLSSADLSRSPLTKHNFQLSLILFTSVYSLIAISILANKAWNDVHYSEIKDGLTDWYSCVLQGGIDCKPSYTFSRGLAWTVAICISTQGWWLLCIFVLLSKNVRSLIYCAGLNLYWGNPINQDIGSNSMLDNNRSNSGSNTGTNTGINGGTSGGSSDF